jgi:hypothetical protein
MGDDSTKTLSRPGKSLRILVVEDQGGNAPDLVPSPQPFRSRDFGRRLLQRALEVVQSKEFDVVLCDIGLRDGSGYDVISQAKRKQPVKCVALAGFDRDEDIRRGKEAGFDFHLTKPVDFHELRTVLDQIAS